MNRFLALVRRRWAAVLGVVLIVVAVGQAVGRRDATRTGATGDRAVLSELLDEFERNRAVTAAVDEGLAGVVGATATFLAIRTDDPVTLDSVTELISSLHLDLPDGNASDEFDSLLEDGGLRLVENDRLNQRLLAWAVLRQQVQDYLEALGRRHDLEVDPALRQRFPLHFVAAHEHEESDAVFEGDPLGVVHDETVREALAASLTAAERARGGVRRLGEAEDEIVALLRAELAGG